MAYFFGWRVSILIVFVVSMLVTPADPLSMCLAAAGLLLVDLALSGVLRLLRIGMSSHITDRA